MSLGCDFEKRSFTVPMGSYQSSDRCECGNVKTQYKYNGKRLCKECWDKIPSKDIVGFNTTKDKLYEFHSSALDMDIYSKSQWKRELKKRGLTDNFEQSERGRVRDIEKYSSQQHSNRVHKHNEVKNSVREALKSMNMYSREKLFIPKSKAPTKMIYGK